NTTPAQVPASPTADRTLNMPGSGLGLRQTGDVPDAHAGVTWRLASWSASVSLGGVDWLTINTPAVMRSPTFASGGQMGVSLAASFAAAGDTSRRTTASNITSALRIP